jgi:hypothetical protein
VIDRFRTTRLLTRKQPENSRPVCLLGVPVELHLLSRIRVAEVIYEFQIGRKGLRGAHAAAGREVTTALDELLSDFADQREAARSQALAARSARQDRVNIAQWLPVEAAGASHRALQLMERADDLCREAFLLDLVVSDDIAVLRRWWTGEVSEQLTTGRPPRPCPV